MDASLWYTDSSVECAFFELITKSFGTFINANECTTKNLTMDVARLIVRTNIHKVVYECIETNVNVERFSIRILEDSYDPRGIMISQNNSNVGRDVKELLRNMFVYLGLNMAYTSVGVGGVMNGVMESSHFTLLVHFSTKMK